MSFNSEGNANQEKLSDEKYSKAVQNEENVLLNKTKGC